MQLPTFQSNMVPFQLMQNKWAAILNPVLSNPLSNPTILTGINLVTGNNTINHLLGQNPQGWFIVDITAAATIYRSQPFNSLTLTLNSSAPATVTLVVF